MLKHDENWKNHSDLDSKLKIASKNGGGMGSRYFNIRSLFYCKHIIIKIKLGNICVEGYSGPLCEVCEPGYE